MDGCCGRYGLTVRRLLLGTCTAAVLLTTGRLESYDWRWFRPSLRSEVQKLDQTEAASLLSGFCTAEPKLVPGVGPQCRVQALSSAFSNPYGFDEPFTADGVIYGHFLAPDGEDADVSGSRGETVPDREGGTLLLARRNGIWAPLWYKSALITRACEGVALPSKREILLCEDEGGQMGYLYHDLYQVDLAHPEDRRESLLAEAVSMSGALLCYDERQVMEPVRWAQDRQGLSVVIRTAEYREHPEEFAVCQGKFKRPPSSETLQFEVTESGIQKVKDIQVP